MLTEDKKIWISLQRIITRLTTDAASQEDLFQECLIRLWQVEREKPGRTRSWYLQNCRFHVQHCLAAGRSVDSLKHATGDKRIPIDFGNEDMQLESLHTNGECFETVCAHDLIAALMDHLEPRETAVLGGLADGLRLREVAIRLRLSYPTALKYRRKIASVVTKLGFSAPQPSGIKPARRHRSGRPPRVALEKCKTPVSNDLNLG